ncbi:MFS transporter [Mycobacterium sp. 21AC1]|uniref:MFS transporter n=1 Tax=[Mycobacterium] appelbergii TaxID=2939269 RepID=UPI002939063C|nr:MFS transporter [Mycobacterium sp. 21AC1]MDV3125400.1 MFS transporter [Mycobacterium sp. 21AC1]
MVSAFLPFVGWAPGLTAITGELGLSYAQAGTISSATGLVAGVMIMAGGVLSARYGSKVIILVGLAVGILGQLIFAGADEFGVVLTGRLLAGVSVGFLWVATYTMAVNWFRLSRQTGRALGIMASGDGIGALLSLFAFAAVLAALGWRMGLTAQAVLMSVVLIVVLVVSKNPPTPVDAPGDLGDRMQILSGHAAGSVSMVRSICTRNVLVAIVFWTGGVGLFSVLASWMPAVLIEGAGFSESRAGFHTSLFSIVGMASALAAPCAARPLLNESVDPRCRPVFRRLWALSCFGPIRHVQDVDTMSTSAVAFPTFRPSTSLAWLTTLMP